MAGWSCKDAEEIEWDGTIKAKRFSGKIYPLIYVTANPASAEEGTLILNTSAHSVYVWYSGDWRLLHTITIAIEYLLTEDDNFIVQEAGDKIIL